MFIEYIEELDEVCWISIESAKIYNARRISMELSRALYTSEDLCGVQQGARRSTVGLGGAQLSSRELSGD